MMLTGLLRRTPFSNIEQSYKASCLEVHDRWLGVNQNKIIEEDDDEDDNVSCLVNINMDIRSDTASRGTGRHVTSPDTSVTSTRYMGSAAKSVGKRLSPDTRSAVRYEMSFANMIFTTAFDMSFNKANGQIKVPPTVSQFIQDVND